MRRFRSCCCSYRVAARGFAGGTAGVAIFIDEAATSAAKKAALFDVLVVMFSILALKKLKVVAGLDTCCRFYLMARGNRTDH